MVIKNKPFVRYHEKRKADSFSVRLNPDERTQLENDKLILEQSKDSTAIKQLARIGSIVLHDHLTGKILQVVLENKRKNKRLGIADYM